MSSMISGWVASVLACLLALLLACSLARIGLVKPEREDVSCDSSGSCVRCDCCSFGCSVWRVGKKADCPRNSFTIVVASSVFFIHDKVLRSACYTRLLLWPAG